MKTNDRPLTDLMKAVDTGAAQLPDFQRGWVWDDGRIKASNPQRDPQLSGGCGDVSGIRK